MKRILVLGATGSIGAAALDVIRSHPDDFLVAGLAVRSRSDEAERLGREFSAPWFAGEDAAARAVRETGADLVLVATVGLSGLAPTMEAIGRGIPVALATKEVLVAAGGLVTARAREKGVPLIPVDSEHSAIFQCLNGEPASRIRRILLTCSGGTFRGRTTEQLAGMHAADALKNPNWDMGAKVTIDSASLVNKGLEVMEAKWLFGVGVDDITVVVQPKSIIHSAVEFVDGTVMAQMAMPDMRLPIQYALTYPDRLPLDIPEVDLFALGRIDFMRPDTETFRGLPLAYRAAHAGGTLPTVFNAANEEAVAWFMKDRIEFLDLYELIESAMDAHTVIPDPSLDVILETEKWAREYVRARIETL